LHIIGGAHVRNILFDENVKEKPSASGVVYVKDGKEIKVHTSKEVILSGGVFGSPQILMLSGIGPNGIGPKTRLEEIGVSQNRFNDRHRCNGVV